MNTYQHPRRLRVQYRRLWSDPWTLDKGTVGIGPFEIAGGNRAGKALFTSIEQDQDVKVHRDAKAAICPLRVGWFVRIVQLADQTTTTGGVTTRAVERVRWTGFLHERTPEHLGSQPASGTGQRSGAARVTWTALGLAGLFAGIDLHRVCLGCTTTDGADQRRMIERAVRFGAGRIPDDRNRGGLRILYPYRAGVHTLHNLVVALIDWHLKEADGSKRFSHWPDVVVGGLTAALEWPVRDVEMSGDLLSALAGILHPRRGLFFTVEPPPENTPSGPVTVAVTTFAASDISIALPGGGTQTIPQNPNVITLNAAVPHRRLRWAAAPPPRRLTLHGGQDVRIVSLRWSRTGGTEDGALTRSWDAADDTKAGDPALAYANVYRTWRIRESWTGGVKGTTASDLPHRTVPAGTLGSPDPLHGAGGLSGETTTSGSELFPEFGIEILDHLPIPSQATNASNEVKPLTDWLSATAGVTLDERAAPLRPMAFVHHRTANTWEKLNVQIDVPDAWTIRLGAGAKDAARIKAALAAADDDLVLTVAIRMPSVLATGYIPPVAASADTLTALDRKRDAPWAERIVVHAGTVMGLAGTAPTAPATDRTVRNDVGLLRASLALGRLAGERSAGAVYEDRAEMDADIKPGRLVTQADLGSGVYQQIGYLVTSVAYDPRPGGQVKTRAQIDIAEIDMETIA